LICTTAGLRRKEDLCRELLALLDKLSPGMSRVRGILLHHLYMSMSLQEKLTSSRSTASTKNKSNGKKRTSSDNNSVANDKRGNGNASRATRKLEARRHLAEAVEILKHEPARSSLREAALSAEKDLLVLDSLVGSI
jgi:hypothetical protein